MIWAAVVLAAATTMPATEAPPLLRKGCQRVGLDHAVLEPLPASAPGAAKTHFASNFGGPWGYGETSFDLIVQADGHFRLFVRSVDTGLPVDDYSTQCAFFLDPPAQEVAAFDKKVDVAIKEEQALEDKRVKSAITAEPVFCSHPASSNFLHHHGPRGELYYSQIYPCRINGPPATLFEAQTNAWIQAAGF